MPPSLPGCVFFNLKWSFCLFRSFVRPPLLSRRLPLLCYTFFSLPLLHSAGAGEFFCCGLSCVQGKLLPAPKGAD